MPWIVAVVERDCSLCVAVHSGTANIGDRVRNPAGIVVAVAAGEHMKAGPSFADSAQSSRRSQSNQEQVPSQVEQQAWVLRMGMMTLCLPVVLQYSVWASVLWCWQQACPFSLLLVGPGTAFD